MWVESWSLCYFFGLASFPHCNSPESHPCSTQRAHSFSQVSNIPLGRSQLAYPFTCWQMVGWFPFGDLEINLLWTLVFKSPPTHLLNFLLGTHLERKGGESMPSVGFSEIFRCCQLFSPEKFNSGSKEGCEVIEEPETPIPWAVCFVFTLGRPQTHVCVSPPSFHQPWLCQCFQLFLFDWCGLVPHWGLHGHFLSD